MSNSSTKAIAARIPFDEYVKLITKASEVKLTISDYIIMKLSAGDKVSELEKKLKDTSVEADQLRKSLEKVKSDSKLFTDANKKWSSHSKQQESTIEARTKEIDAFKLTIEKLRSDLTLVEQKEKSLNDTVKQKTSKISEWEKYASDLKASTERRLKEKEDELSALIKSSKSQIDELNMNNDELKDELDNAKIKSAAELQKVRKELSVVKNSSDDLRKQATAMLDSLMDLQERSTFDKMSKYYLAIINQFRDYLKQ